MMNAREGGGADRPAYREEHVAAYPVEYIAGIDLYNAGEFHAAHDAWEERWMGEVGPDEKLFLQGLIQSAVIFHHLEIGRPGAARRMYQLAKEKSRASSAGSSCRSTSKSIRRSSTARSRGSWRGPTRAN